MIFRREGISLVLVTPGNSAEREWLDENVRSESWQWLGPSLAVDLRFANDLIAGAKDAGFAVEQRG